MSRANLSKKGPRSGLSRDDSSMLTFSVVFVVDLTRELDGEGDGARFMTGDGVRWLSVVPFRVSAKRMFNDGITGGVFTETRSGIVAKWVARN